MSNLKKDMVKFVKKYWILIFIISIIIIFSWLSYASEGIFHSLATNDVDRVVVYIKSFGIFAIFIFLLLTILEVVVAPIPPLVLYLVSGLLFGWWWGGVLSLIGNLIGAVIAFYLARYYLKDYFQNKINSKLRDKFNSFTKKHGAKSLFLLRINPFTSSDIFSYMAGLSHMKVRQLIIGTSLGLAPLVFIQTYIGSDILRNNPFLTLVFIWVGIAYLAIFLYGLLYLWWKNHKSKK